MDKECMVLKLKHPDGSPLMIHEDVDVSVEWGSEEFMPHYLGQLAIAVSLIGAPWDKVKVLLAR